MILVIFIHNSTDATFNFFIVRKTKVLHFQTSFLRDDDKYLPHFKLDSVTLQSESTCFYTT